MDNAPWEAVYEAGAGWQIFVHCGPQDFVEGTTNHDYPMFTEVFVQFPTADWTRQVAAAAKMIGAAPETARQRDALLTACRANKEWRDHRIKHEDSHRIGGCDEGSRLSMVAEGLTEAAIALAESKKEG